MLNKLNIASQFSFDVPKRTNPPVVISSYATVSVVLQDQKNYTVAESGYLPTYMPKDPIAQEKQRAEIWSSLVEKDGVQRMTDCANLITFTLLSERRQKVTGTKQYKVDIVKE